MRLLAALLLSSLPTLAVDIGVFTLFGNRTVILTAVPGYPLNLNGTMLLPGRSVELTPGARIEGPAEFELLIPGKIRRRFRGGLRMHGSTPVIEMGLEDAVASAVAAEMPASAPVEARKAQAVVVRSYYAASGRRHSGFEFCDTTHCQFLREYVGPEPATRGLVVTYQGKPIASMYSASCGGRTRTAAEVGYESDPYPYFSVSCEACRRSAGKWTREVSVSPGKSESQRLELGRQMGWDAVPGNHYRERHLGQVVRLEGAGQGHGLGLCQLGAMEMARLGLSFVNILNYYLPSTTIRLVPSHDLY